MFDYEELKLIFEMCDYYLSNIGSTDNYHQIKYEVGRQIKHYEALRGKFVNKQRYGDMYDPVSPELEFDRKELKDFGKTS